MKTTRTASVVVLCLVFTVVGAIKLGEDKVSDMAGADAWMTRMQHIASMSKSNAEKISALLEFQVGKDEAAAYLNQARTATSESLLASRVGSIDLTEAMHVRDAVLNVYDNKTILDSSSALLQVKEELFARPSRQPPRAPGLDGGEPVDEPLSCWVDQAALLPQLMLATAAINQAHTLCSNGTAVCSAYIMESTRAVLGFAKFFLQAQSHCAETQQLSLMCKASFAELLSNLFGIAHSISSLYYKCTSSYTGQDEVFNMLIADLKTCYIDLMKAISYAAYTGIQVFNLKEKLGVPNDQRLEHSAWSNGLDTVAGVSWTGQSIALAAGGRCGDATNSWELECGVEAAEGATWMVMTASAWDRFQDYCFDRRGIANDRYCLDHPNLLHCKWWNQVKEGLYSTRKPDAPAATASV